MSQPDRNECTDADFKKVNDEVLQPYKICAHYKKNKQLTSCCCLKHFADNRDQAKPFISFVKSLSGQGNCTLETMVSDMICILIPHGKTGQTNVYFWCDATKHFQCLNSIMKVSLKVNRGINERLGKALRAKEEEEKARKDTLVHRDIFYAYVDHGQEVGWTSKFDWEEVRKSLRLKGYHSNKELMEANMRQSDATKEKAKHAQYYQYWMDEQNARALENYMNKKLLTKIIILHPAQLEKRKQQARDNKYKHFYQALDGQSPVLAVGHLPETAKTGIRQWYDLVKDDMQLVHEVKKDKKQPGKTYKEEASNSVMYKLNKGNCLMATLQGLASGKETLEHNNSPTTRAKFRYLAESDLPTDFDHCVHEILKKITTCSGEQIACVEPTSSDKTAAAPASANKPTGASEAYPLHSNQFSYQVSALRCPDENVQVQGAHQDFSELHRHRHSENWFIGFFPASPLGMFLEIWPETGKPGFVAFIPEGTVVLARMDIVHAGGFETDSEHHNPRGHLYVYCQEPTQTTKARKACPTGFTFRNDWDVSFDEAPEADVVKKLQGRFFTGPPLMQGRVDPSEASSTLDEKKPAPKKKNKKKRGGDPTKEGAKKRLRITIKNTTLYQKKGLQALRKKDK